MAKVDLYDLDKKLEDTSGRYISRLYPEDQKDVTLFFNDLLAEGYSPGTVLLGYRVEIWDFQPFLYFIVKNTSP